MTSQNTVVPIGVLGTNTSFFPTAASRFNGGNGPHSNFNTPAPPTQQQYPTNNYSPPAQNRPYNSQPQQAPFFPQQQQFPPRQPPFYGFPPSQQQQGFMQAPHMGQQAQLPPWFKNGTMPNPPFQQNDESETDDDSDEYSDDDDESSGYGSEDQSSTSFTVNTPRLPGQHYPNAPHNGGMTKGPLPNATDFLRWASSRPMPTTLMNRPMFQPPMQQQQRQFYAPQMPYFNNNLAYQNMQMPQPPFRAAATATAAAPTAPLPIPTSHDGRPVEGLPDWDPTTFRTPSSTLILGATGSGKTGVLTTMVSSINNRFDVVILITEAIDTVRAFTERPGPEQHSVLIFLNCWEHVASKVVSKLLTTLDAFSKEHALDPSVHVPSVLLILDDLFCSPLVQAWKGWPEMLKRLHHNGLTTIIGTQSSKDLIPEARENVHNLIILPRKQSQEALKHAYERFVDRSIFGAYANFESACHSLGGVVGRGYFIDGRSFSSPHLSLMTTRDPRIIPLKPCTLNSVDATILLAIHGQLAQMNKNTTRATFKSMADNPAYRKTVNGYVDATTGAPIIDPNAPVAAAEKANEPVMLNAGNRAFAYTGTLMEKM